MIHVSVTIEDGNDDRTTVRINVRAGETVTANEEFHMRRILDLFEDDPDLAEKEEEMVTIQ